jgi:TnpA family transposase
MINVNDKVPDHLVRAKAFEVVPKDDYKRFLSDFKKPNFNREFYRWEQYGKLGQTIKRNIRPIFKVIDFSCDNDELRKAIRFLRNHIDGNQSFQDYDTNDIPLGFFPKPLRRFLWVQSINGKRLKEKVVDGDRYEFMVYWQLQKGIGDITVHIKASSSYRALEDELIDLEYWTTHKQTILKQLNIPRLSTNIVDTLEELEASIESKYDYVNQRIQNGKNTSIKVKRNKQGEITHWTLPYTPLDDGANNHFFKKLPTQNIGDIARFVDEATGYGKAFTHLQPRYAKTKPEMVIIDACVIANATGIEIQKMIDICDIDGQDLKRTNDNFIRALTLCQASDIIVNDIKKLPIFTEYNLSDYGVHASVDGQKLATRFNTIKSRYGKKYFGLRKGVVVVTLSANSLPVCLKVIGANDHESHYLLDLVESNTSEIEITSVSGDMHSINRVNFALMHQFGYRFMPRFTQLNDKSDNKLVCFGKIDYYSHHVIKPSKKADKSLVIRAWYKALRILASLALNKTTQANIVRKLSTAKTINPTLKALIALDEVVMTDFLLGYIDDKTERMAIQRSLCRGESYHQLTSTISKVNGGRMLGGKNEIELTVNAECIRLIANIIIHHNATILSALYQHYDLKHPDKCQEIVRWSPVAWRFVNLIGNYEFYKSGKAIDIQALIEKLIAEFEIDFSTESQ